MRRKKIEFVCMSTFVRVDGNGTVLSLVDFVSNRYKISSQVGTRIVRCLIDVVFGEVVCMNLTFDVPLVPRLTGQRLRLAI